ncbi:unnamed protein product [Didymodactylos carnosus]|uniref:Uncharacterized protein n=1 Tax=Didymodactylos carnosus TaxID=1234261 RepID=A0A813U9Q2_9BILA|nr:unnamed protein product [Didymodactylos carnosus]CAF0899017.1 unnamed protein product [Didymodactylos carnosus]CAF3606572.1 unnamed protein product [Didymodactylos carnosus]CAF3680073.1 unnamed protein product [Didymodactylos carnosus]
MISHERWLKDRQNKNMLIIREQSTVLRQDASVNNETIYYSYHIHVYFLQYNKNLTAEAITLREQFIKQFNVIDCNDQCETWCPSICHWDLNMQPIGPHPIGSWGIYLPLEDFTSAVSWISINHGNLTILVHPNSGYPKIDHLTNAFWIKTQLPLDGDQLSDYAPPNITRTN